MGKELGTNVIVGKNKERILEAAKKVFEGNIRKGTIPEKWDGKAAKRIVEILVNSQE